ncbi:MAG: hypothetical protein J6X55_16590 [Victivallales bacterium]|nr:hypothetical protein [Victivallales bacterium]
MDNLRKITLEISGKPFYDDSEESMFKVCRKLFSQWKPLTDEADGISVMLWIADGSEILTYSGNLDDTFEWAYWQGCATPMEKTETLSERDYRNFFWYPQKYREDVKPRSYRWLKRLIEVIRETCQEINKKSPRIVAIFDNGPEFVISEFKYKRHNEICQGSTAGKKRSVVCNSYLHGDNFKYAAFPEGIPEGISLGRFFGKQFQIFARDMGYDAIWLSNGMGFGRDTWSYTGFLFDGEKFYPDEAKHARESMLEFWDEFTTACPGMCIETRGSNYSAGVEMASDGAPLVDLYDTYKIAPPVNSPWAALNYRTGLEIAAWMSHVANLPDDRFPYRFYPHDPWFLNSPWLDRYGREPWDIYLPLSIGRIDDKGNVQSPNSIYLLTVDDSYGRMPEQVPQEIIPHLIDAFRNAPDSPAPFVWVYPFRKYNDMVHGENPRPDTVLNEDMFLGETIQAGFPLNTVVALENFGVLSTKSIVVMPVSAYGKKAEEFLAAGGRIIFYGSLADAPDSLLKILGIKCGMPVSGKIRMGKYPETDHFRHGKYAEEIAVIDVFDGGPLTEMPDGATVLAEANGRVLASVNGNAAFLRSVLPMNMEKNLSVPQDIVFPVESLVRSIIGQFGWHIEFSAFNEKSMLPRMNISRHDNAFFFSVFARDTTAVISFRTPVGVPILDEMETEISNGCAIWHPSKSWHKRCRVFVEQTEDGIISQKVETQHETILTERFSIHGLKDATVRIFVSEQSLDKLEFVPIEEMWQFLPNPRLEYTIEDTELGKCATVHHINGILMMGVLR